MINLVRIQSASDPLLEPIMALYHLSFPEEERRPVHQFKHLVENQPKKVLNVIFFEDKFAGFFIYWDFKDFYYLEHFAVEPAMRNNKIGQKALDYIAENLKGLRILEVEPPTAEMAQRRIKYYERNGYKILDKTYLQPSYDGTKPDFPLWIMANEDSPLLKNYTEQIRNEVYRNNQKI